MKDISFTKTLISCLALAPLSFGTYAASYTQTYTWSESGLLALTCVVTAPPSPLLKPVMIIADNNMPNGTVLYSWGYNDFFPNITQQCTSSGITSPSRSLTYKINRFQGGGVQIGVFTYMSAGDILTPYTPELGVGIKVYATFNQGPTICSDCSPYYATATTNGINSVAEDVPAGTEFELKMGSDAYINQLPVKSKDNLNQYKMISSNTSISLRGELIKTGFISKGGSIPVNFASYRDNIFIGVSNSANTGGVAILDHSYLFVYTPSCQLVTQFYTIPMGPWGVSDSSRAHYPITGNDVPVNLDLRCSGEVKNVRFKFEDAYSNNLSNNNIALHNPANTSALIDGLEIELLYNNTHVDVDNLTTTNIGDLGSPVTITTSAIFNTTYTAKFTARYIQRDNITSNGIPYTGPVTGKVNMWVTYD
ncbi:fimbrial protein [Hafnia paralvei]|uniref:fimbrial protein n=1 Tax=Hafnia paralvei TaxID=546367 RepID=UPI0029D4C82C|nr:hypothetical protein [Hafnia paralvei]MDX6839700.1 hypothetical protein [Hafnia paralvei]